MADPSGNVQAPGLQPLPCGALQHAAADGQAPPEALLQGASVAWGHLRPAERKAIRATCRNGRHLHDSLTIGLRIVTGRDVTQQKQQQQEEEHKHEKHEQQQQQQEQQQQHRHQPAPPELRASLAAMVRRGAQLRSLALRFDDPDDDRRQAQLLAAVKACSWHSLSCLELRGAVSLSRVVAEAVARCCPQLADLRLVQKQTTLAADPTAFVALSGEAAAEYDYGRSQLLALCGPRLRELQLVGMETEQWWALSYMSLKWCTALTRLELEAPDWISLQCGHGGGTSTASTGVFNTLSQLTNLRSLQLKYIPQASSPEAARPHATSVARLSALTALTRLDLSQKTWHTIEYEGWYDWAEDREVHGAWREVREAHRAALLSALRCMPQLQHLWCGLDWLRPSELAPLTALTCVTLGGLLPPDEGQAPRPMCVDMPPLLHTLRLRTGVSPRELALLRPSAAFKHLGVGALLFGVGDATADGQLLPEAVAAVGPAVRLVLAYRDPHFRPAGVSAADPYSRFTIAGRTVDFMTPREGSCNGHMEWIRQLRGLDDAVECLMLEGLDLSPADLSCLGHTLCNLKELELPECMLPATALPLLRCPMLRLTRLVLDLGHSGCEGMDSSALVPLLMLLCRPHSGGAPLKHLVGRRCPQSLDVAECKRSLEELLQLCFGAVDVSIGLGHGPAWGLPNLSMEAL